MPPARREAREIQQSRPSSLTWRAIINPLQFSRHATRPSAAQPACPRSFSRVDPPYPRPAPAASPPPLALALPALHELRTNDAPRPPLRPSRPASGSRDRLFSSSRRPPPSSAPRGPGTPVRRRALALKRPPPPPNPNARDRPAERAVSSVGRLRYADSSGPTKTSSRGTPFGTPQRRRRKNAAAASRSRRRRRRPTLVAPERLVDDAHERLAVDLGGGEGIVSSNDGQGYAHGALLGGRARVGDETRWATSRRRTSRRGPAAEISASSSAAGGASGWWSRVVRDARGVSRRRRGGGVGAVGGLRVGGRRFAAAAARGDGGVVDRRTAVVVDRGAPKPALRRASPRRGPTRRGPCRGGGSPSSRGSTEARRARRVRGGGGGRRGAEALLLSTSARHAQRGAVARGSSRASPWRTRAPGFASSWSLSQPGRSEPMSSSTRRGCAGSQC